jgi:hypothetical protein
MPPPPDCRQASGDPGQPFTVVPHIGDTGEHRHLAHKTVRTAVVLGVRVYLHLDRCWEGVPVETSGERSQVCELAPEPEKRVGLGDILAGDRDTPRVDKRFDRTPLLGGRIVAEVDLQLGGRRPLLEEPLDVPRHEQQRAEYDHREGNGAHGEGA